MLLGSKDGPIRQAATRSQWNASWYRPQAYYDSQAWRGTWKGEGGGLLINQAPHNLDLWQWICGMPTRIRAFCKFGRYHQIEVEDDVIVYAEYANGATGVFAASTGECPAPDRMEIIGDRGRVLLEDDRLTLRRSAQSMSTFTATCAEMWGIPETALEQIPVESTEVDIWKEPLIHFVSAVKDGSALFVDGCEAIRSLELAHAIHLSSWLDDWVRLPVDQALFDAQFDQKLTEGN